MKTPSKKRRVISLQQKKKVIEASEGKSLADLSRQFSIPMPSIQNIISNKEAILSAINDGGEAKRARMTTVKHEDLEKTVLRWVKSVRSQNVAVTGPLVMEKALILADEENILADMNRLWAQLQADNEVEGDLLDYLAVDDQLETGGALSLAEIAEDVASKNVEEAEVESVSEALEIEDEEPPVTARELIQAKRILQRYADTVTNPATRKLFDQMDDALAEERMKNMKQRSIQDYFAPGE